MVLQLRPGSSTLVILRITLLFSEYHGILRIPWYSGTTLPWYSENDKVILKITRVDEPGLIKKVHQDKGLHFSPKKNVLTNIDASSKRQLLQFYLFSIVLDFISGTVSPLKD